MKLAAITTFLPSRKPLSHFAYHAIQRFLECPEIERILVLGDAVDEAELPVTDKRLKVRRCWKYNSKLNHLRLLDAVANYKPDIVWLNYSYTVLGNEPAAAFGALMLPVSLKAIGFPIVLLLHNYLGAVNLDGIGLAIPGSLHTVVRLADSLVMRSLLKSDIVLTMANAYQVDLARRYPQSDVRFVKQDLYPVSPFQPISAGARHIVTFGYFGTYKKLEPLLDAFQIVRKRLPDATLTIGGQDSSHTPGYLARVIRSYDGRLQNVKFRGYIKEEDTSKFFLDANIICVTNSACPGESAVLRLAACNGRGFVVPSVDLFQGLENEGWGILHYEHGDIENLAATLVAVLKDAELQNRLGFANYRKATESMISFRVGHLTAFRELTQIRFQENRRGRTDSARD